MIPLLGFLTLVCEGLDLAGSPRVGGAMLPYAVDHLHDGPSEHKDEDRAACEGYDRNGDQADFRLAYPEVESRRGVHGWAIRHCCERAVW